jgi:hypothetical protein
MLRSEEDRIMREYRVREHHPAMFVVYFEIDVHRAVPNQKEVLNAARFFRACQ